MIVDYLLKRQPTVSSSNWSVNRNRQSLNKAMMCTGDKGKLKKVSKQMLRNTTLIVVSFNKFI